MKELKIICLSLSFITLFFQGAEAGPGNESGNNIQRNLFEYNLYDRNRDRLRGRGIYDEEEQAYPNEYNYIQQSDARQSLERHSR